jgi:hypothetical protein
MLLVLEVIIDHENSVALDAYSVEVTSLKCRVFLGIFVVVDASCLRSGDNLQKEEASGRGALETQLE